MAIPTSVFSSSPSIVRSELSNLSAAKQAAFVETFQRKSKSKTVAYILWFFFGLHYAYMGKWGVQIVFWLTAGGLFIWWFIDLFRLSGIVDNHNKDVAMNAMIAVKSFS